MAAMGQYLLAEDGNEGRVHWAGLKVRPPSPLISDSVSPSSGALSRPCILPPPRRVNHRLPPRRAR
jgi:hypothetical protein